MTTMKSLSTFTRSVFACRCHRSRLSGQTWKTLCTFRGTRSTSTHVLTGTRGLSSLPSALAQIRTTQPSFASSADDIQILRSPAEFYSTLLDMIRRAQRRIFLSSLYVGCEDIELVQTLHEALADRPSLQLHLQLDYFRSTRPGPENTAATLLPLLKAYPDRVKISFYRSPTLRGFLARVVPRRWDEGWGTWHAKIYGTDDELLLTGANLNTSYFTNRQDRYIHLRNQHSLVSYCSDFLQAVSHASYTLQPLTLSSEEYQLCPPPTSLSNPLQPYEELSSNLSSLQASYRPKEAVTKPEVELWPIIQSGPLFIPEEETALTALFESLRHDANAVVELTSGYFGLYEDYQQYVLRSKAKWRILAASPKANGFYGSSGISGRIPEGYTYLEQRFWKRVVGAGRANDVQLNEWQEEGWTYHAKGIWIRPHPESPPNLTLFGSTNLNSRSARLDTELSFILYTTSERLQRRLADEVDDLWRPSRRVDERTWRASERHVRLGTKVIVAVVGDML